LAPVFADRFVTVLYSFGTTLHSLPQVDDDDDFAIEDVTSAREESKSQSSSMRMDSVKGPVVVARVPAEEEQQGPSRAFQVALRGASNSVLPSIRLAFRPTFRATPSPPDR
jgi:hypothetical protein